MPISRSLPSQSHLSQQLFRTPFSAAYWRCAVSELRDLKKLLLAALFIALDVAIGSVTFTVGPNLQIHFTFFTKALGAMIYGPVMALLSAFVGDNLGFLLHPSGPYFPGYTLSAMLGALLYALFFYRTKIGPFRVASCKLLVNLCVNVGLGCLWSAILYEKGYLYYAATSIVKNGLLLPIEVILLLLFLGVMTPVLVRAKLVPAGMQIWQRKKKVLKKEIV